MKEEELTHLHSFNTGSFKLVSKEGKHFAVPAALWRVVGWLGSNERGGSSGALIRLVNNQLYF